MKNKIAIISQIAWIALVPQFLFMGFLFAIFSFFNSRIPIIFSAGTYLIISYSIRGYFTKDHNNGIQLSAQGKFAEAIKSYRKSIEFFENNRWIDNYRYLTLLSASKFSYREMGMVNLAFCYLQIGENLIAKNMYEKTLDQFPKNAIAESALKIIGSAEQMH